MAMFQVTAAPTRFRRLEGDGIVSGRSEPPIVRGMREIFVRTVAVGREWQSLKAVTCHPIGSHPQPEYDQTRIMVCDNSK